MRNLAPVVGGETPYLQQQNFALSALARRDSSEDPFGTAKAEPATEPTATEDQLRAISERARIEVKAEMDAQKAAEESAMRDFANALKLRLHDSEAT